MGWSITFKSDKEITKEEIQEIVDAFPNEYLGWAGKNNKQSWGWIMAVDVSLLEGNKISISGSYGMSGQIAARFAKILKTELVKNGHVVKQRNSF